MKHPFKIITVTAVILLVISLSLNIVFAVSQGAEPGSEQDPIVSKSYVDEAVTQLAAKVQTLLDQNAQLTKRLATQEQAVKTLQEELKAVNTGTGSGTATAGSSSSNSGGTAAKPAASIGKGTVNVAVLNVRKQNTTNSAIVGKVLLNETLTLVSETGGWYKVVTSKGINGYVMGKFVTVKK